MAVTIEGLSRYYLNVADRKAHLVADIVLLGFEDPNHPDLSKMRQKNVELGATLDRVTESVEVVKFLQTLT